MPSFNANKTKVQLKLALNRLKLLQQKKASLNQQARREIAALLEKGKEESARIRVEHIIREDFSIEALEILELYVEMLLARFGLIEQMQHCEGPVVEAVNTIIYAAPRSDVKELMDVREQLIMKYGKDFGLAAMENGNDLIIQKLKVQTPEPILVNQYLKAIASAYKIDWEPPMVQAEFLSEIEAMEKESVDFKLSSNSDIATTAPFPTLEDKQERSVASFPEFPELPNLSELEKS